MNKHIEYWACVNTWRDRWRHIAYFSFLMFVFWICFYLPRRLLPLFAFVPIRLLPPRMWRFTIIETVTRTISSGSEHLTGCSSDCCCCWFLSLLITVSGFLWWSLLIERIQKIIFIEFYYFVAIANAALTVKQLDAKMCSASVCQKDSTKNTIWLCSLPTRMFHYFYCLQTTNRTKIETNIEWKSRASPPLTCWIQGHFMDNSIWVG